MSYKNNKLKLKTEDFFNVKLFQCDVYHPFDFRDEFKTFYCISSRGIKHNKFESAIIPIKQIETANLSDRDLMFVFEFTDGIYYFKYNRNMKMDIAKPNAYKPFLYVPIEKLERLIEEPEGPPPEKESASVIDYKEKAGDNQYKELVEPTEMCIDEEFGSV